MECDCERSLKGVVSRAHSCKASVQAEGKCRLMASAFVAGKHIHGGQAHSWQASAFC